jgi:hypothetical protein
MSKIEPTRKLILNENSRPTPPPSLVPDSNKPDEHDRKQVTLNPEFSDSNSNKIHITLLSSSTSSSTTSTSSSSNSSSLSSTSSSLPATKFNKEPSIEEQEATTTPKQDEKNSNEAAKKVCSVSRSSSASSSSVIAALSILSFSTTSSASSSPTTSSSSSSSNSSLSSSLSLKVDTEDSDVKPSYKKQSPSASAKLTQSDVRSSKSFSSSHSSAASSKQSSPSLTPKPAKTSDNLTPNDVSELLAPYLHKPFYGKEWLFRKLAYYITHKKLLEEKFNPSETTQAIKSPKHKLPLPSVKNLSTCLVLLGDSGTGKTHLSCELKHPHTQVNPLVNEVRSHLACMHFLSLFNQKQNSLKCFYMHLTRSLQDLQTNLVDNQQQKVLISRKKVVKLKQSHFLAPIKLKDGTENDLEAEQDDRAEFDEDSIDESNKSDDMIECVDSMASKFIGNILKPLNNIENSKNYFILLDGIDDSLLRHERLILSNDAGSGETINCDGEMILSFLNKTFLYFPPWLNLILTSKRSTEKSYLRTRLANIKYEKLSMDKCYNLGAILTEFNMQNSNQASVSSSSTSINNASSSSIGENLNNIQSQIHSLMNQDKLWSNVKNPMELCNAAHFANLKDIQTYILKVNILLKLHFLSYNSLLIQTCL